MSLFAQVDAHLMQCAAEQQAVLTQNRGGMSLLAWGPNHSSFEERRIDWQQDGINRAIIIQPDFLATGVDTTRWNFRAVVWQDSGHQKRTACQNLATSVPSKYIEERIERLLAEACTYLNNIRVSDLKSMP